MKTKVKKSFSRSLNHPLSLILLAGLLLTAFFIFSQSFTAPALATSHGGDVASVCRVVSIEDADISVSATANIVWEKNASDADSDTAESGFDFSEYVNPGEYPASLSFRAAVDSSPCSGDVTCQITATASGEVPGLSEKEVKISGDSRPGENETKTLTIDLPDGSSYSSAKFKVYAYASADGAKNDLSHGGTRVNASVDTVELTICKDGNDPPVVVDEGAPNDRRPVQYNSPHNFAVLANGDYDPDGDFVDLVSVSATNSFSAAAIDGDTVIYTPSYTGALPKDDRLTYTIRDRIGAKDSGSIYIKLTEVEPGTLQINLPDGVSVNPLYDKGGDGDLDHLGKSSVGGTEEYSVIIRENPRLAVIEKTDVNLPEGYQLAVNQGWIVKDPPVSDFTGVPNEGLLGLTHKLNEGPIADFTISPATRYVGDTLTFDAKDSDDPDGLIEKYEWSFGATGKVVDKIYETAGDKQVTLTVTDNEGFTANTTTEFTVISDVNEAPEAIIDDIVLKSESDSTKRFTADGSGSYDPDEGGYITSYEWSVADEVIPTSGDCQVTNGYETGANTEVEIRSDVEGETVSCTFQLTVTDNEGATGIAQFTRSKTCSGVCLIEE